MTTQHSDDRGSLLAKALDEAVSRGTIRVPPYPSTALQLQAVLAKDDYGTQALVDAMRTDQVFTGNLLRLANSPMYRRGTDVTSIALAVQRVGARELTRLAMAASVSAAASGAGLSAFKRRVWRESLAAAVVCEGLAVSAGLEPGEAFVAGLLHDVGKLLALSTLEELFKQRPELKPDDAAVWFEVERTHVKLGALLAQRWQLPGVLGAVITAHHDEREQGAPLTRTVLQADAIVGMLEQHVEVTVPMLLATGLGQVEAERMAERLVTVPGFLNALDADAPKSGPATPAPRKATEWMCLEPVAGGESWPVRTLDGKSVVATATRAQQPGSLIEFSLSPAQLKFWAVVHDCVERGSASYEVLLKPFALSAENARRWDALVSAQQAAA